LKARYRWAASIADYIDRYDALLDLFIAAFKAIAAEAAKNPKHLYNAPISTKVRRMDETGAARKPCLAG